MITKSNNTHEFTVQRWDDSREQSASSGPSTKPETPQGGGAFLSTPSQSAADSPNLPNTPPGTATSPTPDSVEDSPVLKQAQRHAEIAEAIVDDVFSTIGDVLSSRDPTSKEFHSAVLRALSKEPLVVAEAETEQAPGTWVEVESCIKSSVSLLPCSAFTRLTAYKCIGLRGNPCLLFSPLPGGLLFYLLTQRPVSCLITHPPTPFLWCRLQRHPSCGRLGSLFAVWLDEELSWEGVKSLRGLKTTPTGCTV